MSNSFTNPLDNSEFSTATSLKDLQPAAINNEELKSLKLYMEVLQLQAQIEKQDDLKLTMTNKAYDAEKRVWVEAVQHVPVAKLLPQDSDFEKLRKLVILELNTAGPESEKFRTLASRFQTNSIFTLSGKYAHFLLNKRREEETYQSALGAGGMLNYKAGTVDKTKSEELQAARAKGRAE
jgi:hypothetical protein